ncbi:MAG: PQQ-like beta-propeller repeat protein [Pirellulales bacterium]|nr:PQQ-like beta-propeller repeat protein [Pirellulales bacterium]
MIRQILQRSARAGDLRRARVLLLCWLACSPGCEQAWRGARSVERGGEPEGWESGEVGKVGRPAPSAGGSARSRDLCRARGHRDRENCAERVSGGVDWPRLLGPEGNSKSPETGIRKDWGECGPAIVWHRPLGTSYGIGSVADGRFFQFDRYGDQARLTCLDSRTGEFLWKYEYPTDYEDLLGYNNGPRCSPLIDEGLVYLFGAEGQLHCVRADNGKQVWHVDTAKKFGVVQNFFGVGSTPVVEGNLLIVMVGGSPAESQDAGRYDLDRAAGNGTGIVAFDKWTGEVNYAITDELASYATPQLATIHGRRWCFAFARGGLVGFEPRSGEADFHYPWRARLRDSVNASTPVVVGDEVFISETYGPGSSLLRVRPGAYTVVWKDPSGRNKAMQTHWNTPVYHEGYLYGSSGRHSSEAELRCIEWKTGKVMWSEPRLRRASLLYVDGHFVCLSEDGVLRLVQANQDRYVEVAQSVVREATGGPPLIKPPAWSAPVLSHGLLYVRGDDRLVCMRLIQD